jgi:UDP-3-O-[3-hydroxymyristoyl] glucosamine N-acyltransferase
MHNHSQPLEAREGITDQMKGYSLKEIADHLHGELQGDPDLIITRVQTNVEAGPGDIAVAFDSKAFAGIGESKASAFIVPMKACTLNRNMIGVANLRQAFVDLLNLFYPKPQQPAVIHRQAIVDPTAQIGEGVAIGAGAFIAEGVTIGDGAAIYPNVYLGETCEIGEGSEIFPNVTIYSGTRIGKRVRIHSGTVIGSDGFGIMRDSSGATVKIPQVGSVEIGDDVEIGANCSIDRATLGTTRILAGTKIDNLVQIGHNATIGRHCCIVAQVGISGSVKIGDYCDLAGQAGISDHLELGDRVRVGAQSGVLCDLNSGTWLGSPARPRVESLRIFSLLPKLPKLQRQIQALQKLCARLEEQLGSSGDGTQ